MRKSAKRFLAISSGIVAIGVLLAVGGCAVLNGDDLWIGKMQRETQISNTLLTWFPTEYCFEHTNLPFTFTCSGSTCPYDFDVEANSNSVFAVRLFWDTDGSENGGGLVVTVDHGVARVAGRGAEWMEYWNHERKCGQTISGCTGLRLRLTGDGLWSVVVFTSDARYYAELKAQVCKMVIDRPFRVEVCDNVRFWHCSNWYEW